MRVVGRNAGQGRGWPYTKAKLVRPNRLSSMSSADPIRIFCGSDRSQRLPFEVLAHSIRRHTNRALEIRAIDNGLAPIPSDPRLAPYTEFSFARFAIPALCEHAGRAIYMDSDMLVFVDIGELWDTELAGASIAIEIGSRSRANRSKSAAVMLLDCAALDWQVEPIVLGLGKRYDYNELMSVEPLVAAGQMRELIVDGWNDLDRYQSGHTRNLHFTEIRTQPWVYAAHPHGQLWVDEVARMLASGALAASDLEEEVRLGYVRPSLLPQLGLDAPTRIGADARTALAPTPAQLLAYDHAHGYVAHRQLLERFAKRKRAIAVLACQHASARRPWLSGWYRLRLRWRHGK